MSNLLQELSAKVEEMLGHAGEIKQTVDMLASAGNPEQAFIDAVVVALEAMGYTVTPPAKHIEVQTQDSTPPADQPAQ